MSRVRVRTFLEYTLRQASSAVEPSAANMPVMSNEISVSVAITTPPTIATSEKYTCVVESVQVSAA